jgi:hypothetical protein
MSNPIGGRDALCDRGRLTGAAYSEKLLAGTRINGYLGRLNPHIGMSDNTLGIKNTDHPAISAWVEKSAELCKPAQIFWCSGSEAEKEGLAYNEVKLAEASPARTALKNSQLTYGKRHVISATGHQQSVWPYRRVANLAQLKCGLSPCFSNAEQTGDALSWRAISAATPTRRNAMPPADGA